MCSGLTQWEQVKFGSVKQKTTELISELEAAPALGNLQNQKTLEKELDSLLANEEIY